MSATTPPVSESAVVPRSVRGKTLILGLSLVVAAFFALNLVSAKKNQRDARTMRESAVMLADAKRVTLTSTKTPQGLEAQYVAVNPNDASLVKRIRTYLRSEHTQHLRADYSDIRFGENTLPGRADLEYAQQNYRMDVRYVEVKGGAKMQWFTKDPIALQSLYEWFSAVASYK